MLRYWVDNTGETMPARHMIDLINSMSEDGWTIDRSEAPAVYVCTAEDEEPRVYSIVRRPSDRYPSVT